MGLGPDPQAALQEDSHVAGPQRRNSACRTPLSLTCVFSCLEFPLDCLPIKGATHSNSFLSSPRTGPGRSSWPLSWELSDPPSSTATTSLW